MARTKHNTSRTTKNDIDNKTRILTIRKQLFGEPMPIKRYRMRAGPGKGKPKPPPELTGIYILIFHESQQSILIVGYQKNKFPSFKMSSIGERSCRTIMKSLKHRPIQGQRLQTSLKVFTR